MRILHYTLGLPPYRTGGLTKYSVDLMVEQTVQKHEVYLLYPGHFTPRRKTVIKENECYNNVKVYELCNPLPIPLLNGIKEVNSFTKELKDPRVYTEFLEEIQPDVIHLHTLMGVHTEFLDEAQKMNIKIVFTTHDYFGICPKVNLVNEKGQICNDYKDGESCNICNTTAYSLPLIFLMQSHSYKKIKDSNIVKKLRVRKKNIYKNTSKKKVNNLRISQNVNYRQLRQYYISMLKKVDFFHFNSSIAEEQFKKYLSLSGDVIPITHSHIKDFRVLKNYHGKQLNLTFLGPLDEYKGFPLLVDSLKILLKQEQSNWKLNVFGNSSLSEIGELSDYITLNGKYSYEDLPKIFKKTDLLIIPSTWMETFGFIGLEAFSYGIPVMTSNNVGFKDVIKDKLTGFIVEPEKHEMASYINTIINNREILRNVNKNIKDIAFPHIIETHQILIERLYEKVIGAR
ncbi:glycosyltransferase [Priestia megaterium]|uniref:glycosyltransferase n=1 Tax=Priestia megaterium TaxID=1404 RepID=UPI002E206E2A|nr:glycosyltransferase [Priestia megaterium]MED4025086.1 glycosyltransferase [Priestia megaterium]